jgi:hypothetical protein
MIFNEEQQFKLLFYKQKMLRIETKALSDNCRLIQKKKDKLSFIMKNYKKRTYGDIDLDIFDELNNSLSNEVSNLFRKYKKKSKKLRKITDILNHTFKQ